MNGSNSYIRISLHTRSILGFRVTSTSFVVVHLKRNVVADHLLAFNIWTLTFAPSFGPDQKTFFCFLHDETVAVIGEN